MFTTGLPTLVLSFFAAASMAIAIPAGVQIVAWVATIWAGRPVWKTAFLFCVGFLVIFVIGGITGVMVASVPFDMQAHDSYFVVGHLHYVLIGGVAFPIFGAIYYWFPKFTGKLLDERLGKWNFWLLFVGVNLAFHHRRADHRAGHRGVRVERDPQLPAGRGGRQQPVGRRHAGMGDHVATRRARLVDRADRPQPPSAVGSG
jgi:heme/copper-type cytochrome/quinol oxidase subunit 1